jgi:predicted nucleic acid-binding protein
MPAADFLDTNVLINALDNQVPAKQLIAQQIIAEACSLETAVISYQVVQETLNTIQKKFAGRLSVLQAECFLDQTLMPLMKVMPSPPLWKSALRIQQTMNYTFYDSLIIAAAQTAGCKRLLTEDLQHGQVIDGLKIVNPFI